MVTSLFSSTSCCGSSNSISNSTFPGLGFEIPVRAIFSVFFFSQLSATANQRRIRFEEIYRLIDRLINMSCLWSHITKNCLDWDSNPRPGNVEFDVELALPQYAEWQHTLDTQSSHAMKENRESALWRLLLDTVFQWVSIRQLALSTSR